MGLIFKFIQLDFVYRISIKKEKRKKERYKLEMKRILYYYILILHNHCTLQSIDAISLT